MLYYSLSNSGTWTLSLILISFFFFEHPDKCRGSVCCKVMTHTLEIVGITLEITWDSGFFAVLPIHLEFQEAPL